LHGSVVFLSKIKHCKYIEEKKKRTHDWGPKIIDAFIIPELLTVHFSSYNFNETNEYLKSQSLIQVFSTSQRD
jgi:hypothetical protein